MSAAQSLLLLPVGASASLSALYTPTLASLLPKLVPASTRHSARLDIGLALDSSYDTSQPRPALFAPLEALLRQAYSLVCAVAAQQGIDLDLPGGLDVRIFFVHTPDDDGAAPTPLSGPLVSLNTLAASFGSDRRVYVPESDAGLSLANTLSAAFDAVHGTKPGITTLGYGHSAAAAAAAAATTTASKPQPNQSSIHKSIAVGGTFDHLHIGHKLLLTATLLPASPQPAQPPRTITVGITDQELLVNKKHASVLEPWAERVRRTADFVESILCFAAAADVARMRGVEQLHGAGVNGRVTRYTYTPLPPTTRAALSRQLADESGVVINYTLITDPFGPTITEEAISGIVVSAETRGGGRAVNDKRAQKGWKALDVWEVGILDAGVGTSSTATTTTAAATPDFSDKISSTEIRRRLVDMAKEGKL